MTSQSELRAALPPGPRDPLTATPPRRPGSVRRTTSIDHHRGATTVMAARGRDLLTRRDGTAEVLGAVQARVEVDAAGTITAVECDAPVDLSGLVGANASKGFRRRLDELLPGGDGSLLRQVLDDVPMAMLISGYGVSRELGDDWAIPGGAADRLRDLCAGWASEATMIQTMEATGVFPVSIGPPAPDVFAGDDPLAWHPLPELAPRSVRRIRRLDVGRTDGTLDVDVHFRDSHLGPDGPEDVLHEYTVAATVDAAGVVRVCEATPRTLPWPECPGALVSAPRLVGSTLDGVRRRVLAEFSGTTTCTHLNDVLRSLAGVADLAAAVA